MPRPSTMSLLADLAEEQWGLFTRRQAETTGLAWSTLSRLAAEGGAERVAHGVYRLRGAPPVEHLQLRAAWLQLAPAVPAWERGSASGVVSHRSAASLCGLGHLPADRHEFILPVRRQSRRPDVRLHRRERKVGEWTTVEGLPVSRPARTAAELLVDHEDPGAVGHVIADALRAGQEETPAVVDALAPLAVRFGLDRGDGAALLDWLLTLTGTQHRLERLVPETPS